MEPKKRKGEGLPVVGRQPLLRQREKSYLGGKSLKSFSTALLIFSMIFKCLLQLRVHAQVPSITVDYDSRKRRWATIRPNR